MENLYLGIVTGALGTAYFIYGWRQKRFAPLISGVSLCAYSYFVDNWVWLCIIGAVLLIAPFLIDF